jgi:hypothetical protein
MDEGRKRVIGIMAAILAARRLAEFDSSAPRVPATKVAEMRASLSLSQLISWLSGFKDRTSASATHATRLLP